MARRVETFIESFDSKDAAWGALFQLAEVLERRGKTPKTTLRVRPVKGAYWLVMVKR